MNEQTTVTETAEALEIMGIMKVIPHRYPFLMIDRIVDIVPDKSAVGIKQVVEAQRLARGWKPKAQAEN